MVQVPSWRHALESFDDPQFHYLRNGPPHPVSAYFLPRLGRCRFDYIDQCDNGCPSERFARWSRTDALCSCHPVEGRRWGHSAMTRIVPTRTATTSKVGGEPAGTDPGARCRPPPIRLPFRTLAARRSSQVGDTTHLTLSEPHGEADAAAVNTNTRRNAGDDSTCRRSNEHDALA